MAGEDFHTRTSFLGENVVKQMSEDISMSFYNKVKEKQKMKQKENTIFN